MDTPKGYVSPDYLQSVGAFLGQLKQRTYACMKIGEGATVLDVGCGSGLDTVAMAHIVGPTGQVFGVDHDPGMLAEADQRARNENAGAWVQHRQADATSLPFEAGTFDACRSERLFQHLPDAAAALNEMSRVTKPGGMVVALDTDWGSLSTDTTEVDVERRLSRFHAEQLTANGLSGRQLYRLFKKQGLQDVSFEVFPVVVTDYAFARQITSSDKLEREAIARNIVTEEELRRFRADREQTDREGVYFGYCCMMLVAGQKG